MNKLICPNCKGCKGVFGYSTLGHPATLPCPRCDSTGEILENSLTEKELNPIKPLRYERNDL